MKAPPSYIMISSFLRKPLSSPIVEGGEGMAVPPPPKDFLKCDSFECPYCFIIINVKSKHLWAEHVFHGGGPWRISREKKAMQLDNHLSSGGLDDDQEIELSVKGVLVFLENG